MQTPRCGRAVLTAAALLFGMPDERTPAVGDDSRPDFDRQIAPILSRHCLECHGGTERKGGLNLSTKAAALAGSESGKAIVAGKPGESLVWQYVDTGEMPKDRPPLSGPEKRLLEEWIAGGAKWGAATIDPFLATTNRRAGYDWWSLQPVEPPPLPKVNNAAWPRNGIDRFILARLEAKGLEPAGEADRRTLIRRLSFDLTGLPPEPQEVERFLADQGENAYEKLVDRLLDSPHYGERWARHWMDVVRFGETQGFERNRIRENAWRYRDWIIDALDSDMPYDEFVRRQIAGDVLYPNDADALIATGYHVCGTWDQVGHLEGSEMMQKACRQDHLEDLVATLGQAFLGLTINCARCHDHKFDPISQMEYYRIAALVGGVTQEEKERQNISLTRDPEREKTVRAEIAGARRRLNELESAILKQHAPGPDAKNDPVKGLQLLYRFDGSDGSEVKDESKVGGVDLKAGQTPRWASAGPPKKLIQAVKASNELTIEIWITPAKERQSGPARIVTISVDQGRRNVTLGHEGNRFDVRLRTTKTDGNGLPSLSSPEGAVTTEKTHVVYTFDRGTARLYVNGRRVAERTIGGELSNWDEGFRLGLGDELAGARRWEGEYHFVALYDRALAESEIAWNFRTKSQNISAGASLPELLAKASQPEQARHKELTANLERLEAELNKVHFSGAAHVIIARQPPVFHVLARGDFRNRGEIVAPAGLKALRGLDWDFKLPPDAPEARRRIKLAEWLTDPRNPLTARVLVNRLWHYHFGQGIVETPSDFGFNGGRPSHPELLDWLAHEFVSPGSGDDRRGSPSSRPWSIKRMQRLIVTSAAYRQASRVENDKAAKIDGGNRLLWRFNRRQLEGEAVRDAVLAVSGALNVRLGGPGFRDVKFEQGANSNHTFTDPTNEFSEATCRRTIYRLWARSGGQPMLESLDCPDPSVMMPRRTKTITPIQALSLFNNPFIERCAARFAKRVRDEAGSDASRQVERAYRLALARPPSDAETKLAREFVSQHGLEQFCLVLFNANEFLFVN